MEYQTKSDWMKQTGSLGAISELSIYDSPYSGCPSANSIYGKNLTMGVLPKEFKAPNLSVVPSTEDWVYKDRTFLQHFNGNAGLNALNQFAKANARSEGAIGPAGGHSVVNPDNTAVLGAPAPIVTANTDVDTAVSPEVVVQTTETTTETIPAAVVTAAGAGDTVTGTITPKEGFDPNGARLRDGPDVGTMYHIPGLVGSMQTCECFKERCCPCKNRSRCSPASAGYITLACVIIVACILGLIFGCCPSICKPCEVSGGNGLRRKSKW